MPNEIISAEGPGSDLLIIYFGTKEPFPAEALGKLFSALAADYRRFSRGDELVLVRAEDGSLRVWLGSIAAAAATLGGVYAGADKAIDGFNHLYDFGKNVSEIISRAHEEHPVPSGRGQRPGVKSAQAILETAVASKSRLRVQYRSPDGEQLILELDPPQVEHAHEVAKGAARASRHRLQREAPRPVRPEAMAASLDAKLDDYAARRALASPAAREREDAALVVAIGLFVEALRANGSDYAVETVAQKLEARGLYDVAQMVRQALGGEEVHQTITQ